MFEDTRGKMHRLMRAAISVTTPPHPTPPPETHVLANPSGNPVRDAGGTP